MLHSNCDLAAWGSVPYRDPVLSTSGIGGYDLGRDGSDGAMAATLPWFEDCSPGTCVFLFRTTAKDVGCSRAGFPYEFEDRMFPTLMVYILLN